MEDLKCICGFGAKSKVGLITHQRKCVKFQGTAVFPKDAKIEQKVHEPHILNVCGKKVVV